MIAREVKRKKTVLRYEKRRNELQTKIRTTPSLDEKLQLQCTLQKLPRNSAPVRLHNRCSVTGRPKGYYRYFQLSRQTLREMAHEGLLPGVTKSSW